MIVFDSSTLILLAKIELIETFISDFHGKVLIPERIKSEVCIKGREEAPVIEKMIKEKKINILKIKNDRQMKKIMEDFSIDSGEAEALLLSMQEKINIVATDDRNAIRACKMLNLGFITAISFLIRANEKGLIKKDDALLKLRRLASIGRYKKDIIKDAEKHIKEVCDGI